ncbi:hypothetical protein J8J14_16485 [Roseomonas sp. SSH11]|uniref:Uncharacterized protein n=1 Tax=Pararoseomonas baculiformis TaxID=2820812 RepID=A0ABS4AH91_9PROT|nr:hypothetical protein [Pararoseomonas baculiformis]MBP0446373.1 hypothetical protein [Pararoseomonas baculiformis]
MANTIRQERRILTDAEFETVAASHYPAICDMPREELVSLARRLREYHGKARDLTHHRRREQRGKAEPRGTTPAPSEAGTSRKKQVFAAALKRLNRQIARLDDLDRGPSQGEIARRALEMKRANQRRHHPSAGRSAGRGMQARPSTAPTLRTDPREIGRVSQFVRDAQLRRDG